MKNIYFDNASTTISKPSIVTDGVYNFLTNNGHNSNRGSNSHQTDRIIWETRKKIADFFDFNKPENVIFTKNITDSINIILRGLLTVDDHIITSNLEHNAVFSTILGNNIDYSIAKFDICTDFFIKNIKNSLKPNTKAIIMLHASNVTGDILPIDAISDFCKQNNLIFILDTAQTAGILPISAKKVDIITFTGHKTLYGIMGIGGFIVNNADLIRPTNFGGTGLNSSSFNLTEEMPNRFEVGTLNIPAIISLYHSFDYISFDFFKKEADLLKYFEKNIAIFKNIEQISLSDKRVAISSLNFKNCDNSEVCDFLNSHKITIRSGLHCSPLAHKTLCTEKSGTVRFSFSHQNTIEEIDFSLEILEKLSKY